MAGLWCVNIGYGRPELAEVAARQMRELPYYNTFFQTTHIPALTLAARIAELTPGDLNQVFYASGGSEANDTNIRLVRHYWAIQGKPEKNIIISRHNAYHGSSLGSASLGGMKPMHKQGGMPIPDIVHIDQPDWWSEGGEMSREDFGVARAQQLAEAIAHYGENRIAAFIAEPVQGAMLMTFCLSLMKSFVDLGELETGLDRKPMPFVPMSSQLRKDCRQDTHRLARPSYRMLWPK